MRPSKAGAMIAAIVCATSVATGTAQAVKHASPNGRHNVSINVSENPVVAGDALTIWGRLTGPNNANRSVVLWHRINPNPNFTPVQTVSTDANGFYAIFRSNGVVDSNRSWFVKSLNARSRTIHERVYSLVALSGPADGSVLQTGPAHKVTFNGTVTPAAAGDKVVLQRQDATGNGLNWGKIDSSTVKADGTYSIVHTFRVPGDANLRTLVKATRRHIASPSNVLSYQISQAQNPALTITPSADPITVGQSVTLTGTVQGGAGQAVTLFAKQHGQQFSQVAQGLADGSGNYTFTQVPVHNTIYQVKSGTKRSAQLFEGVKDLLTANVSATTVDAGQPVTFSGTVSPDKSGHVIYLQRQNPSGTGFHTVQVATVGPLSTYSITRRLFNPGTKVFRVLIPGGAFNQGAASQAFTITVNPSTAQAVNGSQPDNTDAG
jgi:hypothetical protein